MVVRYARKSSLNRLCRKICRYNKQNIGGTLGLLVSQFVYDLNPKLYLIGYVI